MVFLHHYVMRYDLTQTQIILEETGKSKSHPGYQLQILT